VAERETTNDTEIPTRTPPSKGFSAEEEKETHYDQLVNRVNQFQDHTINAAIDGVRDRIPEKGPGRFFREILAPNKSYPRVALKYWIGDALMTLSGFFLPGQKGEDGKETKNTAKSIAGMFGQANSAVWLLAGEEDNQEIVAKFDEALSIEDEQALKLLAAGPRGLSAVRNSMRAHSEWLGNAFFVGNAAATTASAMTRDDASKYSELANGIPNLVAYSSRGLRDFEDATSLSTGIFKDPHEYGRTSKGRFNPMRGLDALRYDTKETQSNMGIFTTIAGSVTGAIDFVRGRIIGGALQMAASFFYVLGDFDLRNDDVSADASWVHKELGEAQHTLAGLLQQSYKAMTGEALSTEAVEVWSGTRSGQMSDDLRKTLNEAALYTLGSSDAWGVRDSKALQAAQPDHDTIQKLREGIESDPSKIVAAFKKMGDRVEVYAGICKSMKKHDRVADGHIIDAMGYLVNQGIAKNVDTSLMAEAFSEQIGRKDIEITALIDQFNAQQKAFART